MNALYCKEALLMELVRHCAYAALLTEEGLLLSLVDPIQILTDFCAAVKSVYASASVSAVVEANVFYACVLRYLVACALERDGYCALAYEALTGLVERLSVSCSSDSSAGGGEGSFWLSDHLMLLSFIQMRRAGLAVYLGVSEDIQRSAVALDELCSSYNFIFGILVSQLLEAHQLQVNGCHAAALSFLDKTISSASRIGIEVVISRGLKLKVLSFSFLTEWPKSIATLEKLSNTATNDVSFVAALVNAEVEILLQSNTLESTNAANLLGDLEKLLTPNYLNPHNSYESNLKNLTKMRVSHRDIVALYATTIRVLTLLAHFDPEKYTPLKRRLLNQLKEAARSLERRHLYRGCGSGIANLPSKILYEALLHDELSKLVK
ncbi:hypothetical protein, conserved [Angomonas deanei]|uniref:Uncharacterized protein n=1 Tax=Angomonas deanei TaxID=59799 RepID=A0A7G2CH42_9TRYP|nr:hypothetical protein, conserved [Angomonas deanei]